MMVSKSDCIRNLIRFFPEKLKKPLNAVNFEIFGDLCEIRIRAFRPIAFVFPYETFFLTDAGRLSAFYSMDCISLNDSDVTAVFSKMCNYSVYSYAESISKGFITLENGVRVGVYGTAVSSDEAVSTMRNIRGMNIRIPAVYNGVSEKISKLFEKGKKNVLICGPPSSGKTTVLKDLCRYLSDIYLFKLAVIDERGEFEKEYVGYNADVLSFYPKKAGIEISVRTLSPDFIICDEIGDSQEVEAILDGLNSGVNFVMTIHCKSVKELLYKKQFKLLKSKAEIDYCIFLKKKSEIDSIINFKELADENDCVNRNYNNLDIGRVAGCAQT